MDYSRSGDGWQRVSRENPCPICGKADNCTVAQDGGVVWCGREPSDRQNAGGQYLHRLGNDSPDAASYEHPGHRRARQSAGRPEPSTDWNIKAAEYARSAAEKRRELADVLGVSPEALEALGVGWGEIKGWCWTFPERDSDGQVIGISRRYPGERGRKRSVGKRGLTYAPGWDDHSGPLLLPEGGSDTAALLTMGLSAVGRPSNTGGVDLLAGLLRDVPQQRQIIVLGECDEKSTGEWPGRDGAVSTAQGLADRLHRPICWALPPDDKKDVREWLAQHNAGGPAFVASLDLETVDPLSTPELPPAWEPFPVDVLPEPLRSFVRAASSAIGCDPSMVAVPLLSVVAGAVGNSARIALKRGWTEPAVVWSAVVSQSGTLKSPAVSEALRPVTAQEMAAAKRHEDAMCKWARDCEIHKADLADWRQRGRKNGDPPPDPPQRPACERMLCSDTTVEALAVLLSENPRGLLLCRDELGGWFKSFNEYKSGGGGDAEKWLSLHRAGELIVDRKGGDRPMQMVPRAAVSICGGIQPQILRDVLTGTNIDNGMGARLLMTMPPLRTKRWTDAELTDAEREPLARLLTALREAETETDAAGGIIPRTLTLNPDAREAWIEFHDAHADEQMTLADDQAVFSAMSKLEGYAARLALLVHLVREFSGTPRVQSPDAIDGDSIAAGIRLSRWFSREARRIYAVLAESRDDRRRRELVELIRRKGGSITPRDLARSSRQYRQPDAAEEALLDLTQAGLGNWRVTRTGGRDRREFVLRDPVRTDVPPAPWGVRAEAA